MASRFGGAKGKEAQRAAAVYHIKIATGRIQPAAVYRQTNHVAGAEALRRRGFWRGRVRCPDYLYAYGLGACFNDALAQVRELIPAKYGANYLPEKPNFYKSKKDAQEAHEAVRPTEVARTPEDVRKYLDDDLFKLYQLIWQRFVASQMLPAILDQTTIDISAGDYTFRATGSVQKFDGYLRVYQLPAANADREDDEKSDEGEGNALPRVTEGQVLRLDAIRPEQHFTEPPPRYTE